MLANEDGTVRETTVTERVRPTTVVDLPTLYGPFESTFEKKTISLDAFFWAPISRVEFEHFKMAVRAQNRKRGFAWDLRRTLRHPDQQPGLILKAEDSRIQQACHLHALHARADVLRPEYGVLSKTLRQIVYHEPFGVLEYRSFARRFATKRNGVRKPEVTLGESPYLAKGIYRRNH